MKVKALAAFRSKLLNPCKKFLQIFKIRLRKPILVRALRVHVRRTKAERSPLKNRITAVLACYRSIWKLKQMDRVRELSSVSRGGGHDGKLFPSPITPTYARATGAGKKEASVDEDVEDACRSFENYLIEMIVEEGKVRDLMDVGSFLIAGRIYRAQFSLIWFLDSMENYARTFFPLRIMKHSP